MSLADGFDQLIVPDFSDAGTLSSANNSMTINVFTVVLAGKNTGTSVNGSAGILNLVFRGIGRGTSDLEISGLELRNASNIVIQPHGLVQKGKIIVN